MQNCVICASKSVNKFKKIDSFPAIVFPVHYEIKDSIEFQSLSADGCTLCQHIFQTNVDEKFLQKIYAEYYHFYPFANLELLNDAYRVPFEKVWKSINFEKRSKLLEIGTSEPKHMELFLEMGMECFAINPGAKESGSVHFFDAYYEEYDFGTEFEIIVARFVLEHVKDLEFFVRKLIRELAHNGILIIQVPNTKAMMRDGTLNFLAHEHTQYFTRQSLTTLFYNYGFTVIKENPESEASIIMALQLQDEYQEKSGNKTPREFSLDRENGDIWQVKDSIEEEFGTYEDIAFYGAGMSLTELLYNSKSAPLFREFARIIDDNAQIKDMYMPKTSNPILNSIDSIANRKTKILLTCRKIYESKIISQITQQVSLNQIFIIRQERIIPASELED